ncbi:MAG TPA: hypothetical protein DD491_07665 [Halieaceae bacterium]|nr:hypothetical protein [Halieaceae bacterium]
MPLPRRRSSCRRPCPRPWPWFPWRPHRPCPWLPWSCRRLPWPCRRPCPWRSWWSRRPCPRFP